MKCICPKCKHYFMVDPIRKIILQILIKPTNVTEIKEKVGCSSFGTIAYHLRLLENEGLIKKEKIENLQGRPTYYKQMKGGNDDELV